MKPYVYPKDDQTIEDLLTIADCAKELIAYRCPYEKGTPAYQAWSELKVAFRLKKKHERSAVGKSEVQK